MRTTIDLPDQLFRELKAVSATQGTSLKTFIRTAVEAELRKAEGKTRQKLTFPLLVSHEPGSLDLSNADIDDLSS